MLLCTQANDQMYDYVWQFNEATVGAMCATQSDIVSLSVFSKFSSSLCEYTVCYTKFSDFFFLLTALTAQQTTGLWVEMCSFL